MLRLNTLGALTLQVEGDVVTGAATQRRRLALFALLATAGDRGITRDKLLGLLWPDSQMDRARHVLAQLLHAQRRTLEEETLFLGTKTLRLNPACFAVDLWEFRTAIAGGQLEEAAHVYRGPFLDGFFLNGAPDFDHWLERQREEITQQARQALEALADGATAKGDPAQAAIWLRRVVQLDPYSGRLTLRLMEALAASGDRAGAIQTGTGHIDRVRRDLGLEIDPSILRSLQELRSPAPQHPA
jgi:DNA-binding SARP family transcriptional activator